MLFPLYMQRLVTVHGMFGHDPRDVASPDDWKEASHAHGSAYGKGSYLDTQGLDAHDNSVVQPSTILDHTKSLTRVNTTGTLLSGPGWLRIEATHVQGSYNIRKNGPKICRSTDVTCTMYICGGEHLAS